MSILSRLSSLFHKETVKEAGTEFIRALAEEAIKSGDPAALVEVAATWETLMSGEESLLFQPTASAPALPVEAASRSTTPDEMQVFVLEIMRSFWMQGRFQMTNGDIRKALDARMAANGGWKDGDLEDWDETRPGIQHRWRRTLTECLKLMRARGIIENGADAWKTYTLCPAHRPSMSKGLPSGLDSNSQFEFCDPEPNWESVV